MKKTIRPSLFFFYLAYTFILFQAMFNNVPSVLPFYSIIDKLIVVLIFLTVLFQNQIYKIREIVLVVIIFSITVISYLLSKDNIILKVVMLIIASKDIELKKFIKFDLVIKVIFCCMIIIFSRFLLLYLGQPSIRSPQRQSRPFHIHPSLEPVLPEPPREPLLSPERALPSSLPPLQRHTC